MGLRSDPIKNIDQLTGHLGYLGHLNIILGIDKEMTGDKEFSEIHFKVTQSLKRSLSYPKCLIGRTYQSERYVPDALAALVGIQMHSKSESAFVNNWLKILQERLTERKSGLFYFSVDQACHPIEIPRGIGTTWNNYFLGFLDRNLQLSQHKKMREQFEQRTFSLNLVREWPHGIESWGDVDSGPVIFGVGPAASTFAISGALAEGDQNYVDGMMRVAEIVGTSIVWKNRRSFLIGPLVGEAIYLTMLTSGTKI